MQRKSIDELLTSILEPYCPEYRSQVRTCLERQGGLNTCCLSFYQEHDLGEDGECESWRLEGPSLVWYFRGYPHVHIWIHVASDPAAPFSSHFG